MKRETKDQVRARLQAEGRLPQAEAALAELKASGLSSRQAQEELVKRFQPLDGTPSRAWPTPNSWDRGREAGRKPLSMEEKRDNDIVWAYHNFKTDPAKANGQQDVLVKSCSKRSQGVLQGPF